MGSLSLPGLQAAHLEVQALPLPLHPQAIPSPLQQHWDVPKSLRSVLRPVTLLQHLLLGGRAVATPKRLSEEPCDPPHEREGIVTWTPITPEQNTPSGIRPATRGWLGLCRKGNLGVRGTS